MIHQRTNAMLAILMITLFFISGAITVKAQATSQPCEACSMTVEPDAQAHLKVVDSSGNNHYVDCIKCAFKLFKNTQNITEISITTNCDWNGPSYVISINLVKNVNLTTVNPPTALLIDGGCTSNRIVYDQASADALIASNGTSQYITALQKNGIVQANATVITLTQAALKYAYPQTPDLTPTSPPTLTPTVTSQPTANPTPTAKPTPSATPTPSPAPNKPANKECEICGMDVSPEAQVKYTITDGLGSVHYAECFMCTLQLVNHYDNLTIKTYCDWYGPEYPIIIESSQNGKAVNVTPLTALFLKTGNCVTNRVAYNQTAADELLINGYSKYTLQEQHYDLPADTKIAGIAETTGTFFSNAIEPSTTGLLIAISVAGIGIIALSIIAYKKILRKKPEAQQ